MDGPTGHRLWGRGAELARIERWVRTGFTPVSVLVVAGEPGIGNSSVWNRGFATARSAGITVRAAACDPGRQSTPYEALEQLLGDDAAERRHELPGLQRDALERACSRSVGPTRGDARTVAAGALGLVRTVAAGRPILLAVDDLQWVDDATPECLVQLARRPSVGPLGLLLTARPLSTVREADAEADRSPRLLGAAAERELVQLGPLDASAIGRVLAERIRYTPDPERVRSIAAETGGSPFWAIEIGRAAGGHAPADATRSVHRRGKTVRAPDRGDPALPSRGGPRASLGEHRGRGRGRRRRAHRGVTSTGFLRSRRG